MHGSLSEVEMAKLMQRITVHETVVPLLHKGQARSKELLRIAEAMILASDACKGKVAGQGVIMSASVEEVMDCMTFIQMLVDETAPDTGDALERVLSAKRGLRFLVKNAIMQQPFYRAAETELRQARVSAKTLLPEKVAAEAKVPEMELQSLMATCGRLPAWLDGLRRGDPFVSLV